MQLVNKFITINIFFRLNRNFIVIPGPVINQQTKLELITNNLLLFVVILIFINLDK